MDRRKFICTVAGGLIATPLDAAVEQAGKISRIGLISLEAMPEPASNDLRRQLSKLGWIEGRNIAIEARWAGDKPDRLPALAAELVASKVDVIMAIGDLAIRAARQATPTTPIVAASDDLAGERHVKNLARPEGNVTGVSILSSELNGKRLELLHEAAPSAKRIAILWDPATGSFHLTSLRAVARQLGLDLSIQEVRRPEDLSRTLETVVAWPAEALNTLASPLLHAMRSRIIEAAARYHLPAIYQWDESAREGGLMAYGPTLAEVVRETAVLLDRILKGKKPADLSVEQPTTFQLIVNLRTAKALGITVPQSLLLRADEVIQ